MKNLVRFLLIILSTLLFTPLVSFSQTAGSNKIICNNCAFENSRTAVYCTSCGTLIKRKINSQQSSNHIQKKGTSRLNQANFSSSPEEDSNKLPIDLMLLIGIAIVIVFLSWVVSKKEKAPPDLSYQMDKTRIFLNSQFQTASATVQNSSSMRRFKRAKVRIPVFCQGEDIPKFKGLLVDMTIHGIGIVSKIAVPKDTRIEILFPLKGGQDYMIPAKVAHSSPISENSYKIGFSFFHLFKRQEQFIQKLIEEAKDKE